MDGFISSLIAFLIALVPVSFGQLTKSQIDQTTVLFTGDIMLGRSVMGASLDNNDPFYPFRKTSEFLKNADITFANLENPIVSDCQKHVGGFKFCTTPEIAKGLSFAGIDIVTLANNHSGNYGGEGFEETKRQLTDIGVKSVGYGNFEIIEKGGITFGFMGFDYVSFGYDDFEENDDWYKIQEADKMVDVLIVGVHWGDEYKAIANNSQRKLAKRMVESGADVVIGHHPHWVQDYEEINGKPVYYSLGNFIFDQTWSEETKKGLVVKMTFEDKKIVKTEEFKTYTPVIGQPILQEGV